MLRRGFVRLSARKERDARNSRRHRLLQALDRLFRNLGSARLLRALLAGDDHVRFQHHAFEVDASVIKLAEYGAQRPLRHPIALVDVVRSMCAVHQNFRLDDRHDIRFLRDQGKEEVRISINLSPTCLMRDNFFRTLSSALETWKVPGEQIEVEITENICIRNPEAAIQQLKKLQGLGTRIAIDDFGTGYSSLAYLQRFPVDTLKIDRSFISEIGHDGGHFPVVLAVVAIASGLSLDLVAEGVESATQADYLEQAGCRIMQGYHFHKPMQLEQFADLLQMPASARRTGAG